MFFWWVFAFSFVGMRVVLLLLVLAAVTALPVKNVVVLMMENRSFDHLLGWLHETNPEVEGLTGNEWNSFRVDDPEAEKVYVNKNGYDVAPDDPNHDFNSTTEQIFGHSKTSTQRALPRMNGFVQNAKQSRLNTTNIMSMFTQAPDSAPVINQLALEFAVFDHWYASLPGPVGEPKEFFFPF
jgi:phospholipase C